jgi:hypothetical protein
MMPLYPVSRCVSGSGLWESVVIQVIGCTDGLKKKVSSGQTVNVLFSVAPVGKPHIGLLLPLARLADFVRIGCKVIIQRFLTSQFILNYLSR